MQESEALYDGCPITKEESQLLILSYVLRHNLPDVGLENELDLLDCHLPYAVYKSKYRFLKSFPYPDGVKYYYCDVCALIVPFETDCSQCTKCMKNYRKSELEKLQQFFMYIPLMQQLAELFNSKLYCQLGKIPPNDRDIVNGKVYRQLKENGTIGANDISLTWNTDGVRIFKSSNEGLWVLQACVNELPYRLRKNNIFICGIWVNKKKPDMNMFLDPFTKEMTELATDGLETTTYSHQEPITIKVHTILSSMDSVARPMVQKVKQYNGEYGCSYCLHKGEIIEVGRGTARVYCFIIHKNRSCDMHKQFVDLAESSGKCVKGVKGRSVVSNIPNMSIIHSCPPEYLHSWLLGVGQLFAVEWFNSANSNEEWYLGTESKDFKSDTSQIKPPCEITRLPEPITDKSKASETKNFICYYSLSLLKKRLPTKYYKHWFLFVFSTHIYLKRQSTDAELKLAKKALYQFVSEVEELYGKRFMRYNVHLLLHIPVAVKNYGGLWAWSAFPFESYNGVVKKLFHGTQCISEQIVKIYSRLRYIKNNSHVFEKENCSIGAKRTFIKIMNQIRVKNCIEYEDNLRIFGKPRKINFTLTEKVAVEELVGEAVDERCERYHRFVFKNILYHSLGYQRLVKRNNSCILTTDNEIFHILSLIKIMIVSSGTMKYIILGRKFRILNEALCRNGNYSSRSFSFLASETPEIACREITSIVSKCVNVPVEENIVCIIPVVNTLETD